MNKIVEAVLYEGYILYPYRPSSKKNVQRFTFGRVYPYAYSVAQNGAEPFAMKTECLATSESAHSRLEGEVRFLQIVAREVLELPEPLLELPKDLDTASLKVIPLLRVGEQQYSAWQEAVEQTVILPADTLQQICASPCRVPFNFPVSSNLEPIRNLEGSIIGLIRRRGETLVGTVELTAEELDPRVIKISVNVANQTPMSESDLENQYAVLMRTFASTHTVLHLTGAEFVSLMDPPPALRKSAGLCKNEGTWPVLVGDEEAGDRSTMLSSPIILYDYPKIAPESPGELFDGTEIDEILTLRVMTMTDVEKQEMRQSDERGRQILERVESLGQDELLRMHGSIRELRSFDEDFFSNRHLEVVELNGAPLRVGDRVKIRPKSRADIMDIALEGKTAIVEAIEEDAEQRIHLALVLDEAPGKDLGLMRQPGHRFFYTLDEVEALGNPE
ncbi:MAG TPA: hypothetical protein VE242_08550 [Chthoniobacterales bacterium]|nr:hypothetical protein [Chthoniobacterales bacterium]